MTLEALDIFRASYHRSVAPGQSVLLQCCVKDNRRREVKPPISWEWVDVATRARLAETSEPYVLVNNITAPAGAAVASYSCTARSTGYRDYTDVAIVAISGKFQLNISYCLYANTMLLNFHLLAVTCLKVY